MDHRHIDKIAHPFPSAHLCSNQTIVPRRVRSESSILATESLRSSFRLRVTKRSSRSNWRERKTRQRREHTTKTKRYSVRLADTLSGWLPVRLTDPLHLPPLSVPLASSVDLLDARPKGSAALRSDDRRRERLKETRATRGGRQHGKMMAENKHGAHWQQWRESALSPPLSSM